MKIELNPNNNLKKIRQLNKYDVIEFYQKYKFEIAVAAAAVVCVVSMIVAAVMIFSQRHDEPETRTAGEEASGGIYGAAEGAVMELSWDNRELRLENGEAHDSIEAEILTEDAADKSVTWTSSNKTIADVDDDGSITAYAPGEVILEATHTASGAVKDARLTVIRPVESIFMPTTETVLYIGGSSKLLQTWLTPDDASISDLRWKSENPSVAEVDDMGRVKPVSAGMTEIIVSNSDGTAQSKCFVTVVNQTVNVEKVEIQNKENNTISVGEKMNTVATVLPENAKNKTLRWTSDDDAVATVNMNGTIQATGEGTAMITAEASNGVTDSFLVTVKAQTSDNDLDMGVGFLDGFSMIADQYITSKVVYTPYDITIDEMVNIQSGLDPPPNIWTSGGNITASTDDIREYTDPNGFYTDAYKYQFLDLSHSNGISEESLNAFLENKGILRGQASTFIEAANEFGVSEIYLAAHACLETGNGTSQLATGVEVNGETVYNMFGIAAYDSSALYSGSQYAYKAGWTSVEAAIRGGAEWISEKYINSEQGRQNTLYKMRWNPENPSEHQYATDIGWAIKQAISMEVMLRSFPEAVLTFDVPVYSGMIPPVIET